MKKLLLVVLCGFAMNTMQGAGFRVALQSARQQGMGHVGAGMDLGPASIFFNPGALAITDNTGISISGSAVMADIDFNSPGSTYKTSLEDNVGTPFAAYGNFRITERLAGGLGVYTPYGNTVEWPEDWGGRYVSQSVDLLSVFIQPTLSYKVNDKLGIGAGFIYTLGEVTLERGIPLTTSGEEPDATLETDDFATGMGYNVGVFYEPTDEISFGANFRSKVEVEAEDGIVNLENIPQSASDLFTATSFNAELPLPAELAVGAGMKVTDRFTLGADMNYVFWSQYEELTFNYDGSLGGSSSTTIPQNWEDAFTFKLGGDYQVSDQFNVRAGGYYDFTPIPDETLSAITPDADRYGATAGFSYLPTNKLSIDGSILYINGEERTVLQQESELGFGQRYKNTALVPGLGINYSFN